MDLSSIYFLFAITSVVFLAFIKDALIAVFWFIAFIISIALILISYGLEFFGFFFILIYVGAIAILFLFLIMLFNLRFNQSTHNFIALIPFSLFITFIPFYYYREIDFINYYNDYSNSTSTFSILDILGYNLFSHSFIWLLLMALLFLIALIGPFLIIFFI